MGGWLSVDLTALVSNARSLASRVKPATFCAVVKSNAYGHGLVPVAAALTTSGIPGLRLAVFAPAEGLALRSAGIRGPILVVGPATDGELAACAQAGLECALLDAGDVARFAPHGLSVHVKVDTGVSRFGIAPADAAGVVARCRSVGLNVTGVYSHLANAEDLDEDFTLAQLKKLSTVVEHLRSSGEHDFAAHIAASAAAMLWPQTRLDMVRVGIALYGRWPSPEVRTAVGDESLLSPALRWFAPIEQIREVPAKTPVGYGCVYAPATTSMIGVLPVGYADGLPRAAGGGKLEVRLPGGKGPIVGRVCMNACMIDVTHLDPAPRRGDVAELDVDDVARAAGTINYEVLARLSPALDRRYR